MVEAAFSVVPGDGAYRAATELGWAMQIVSDFGSNDISLAAFNAWVRPAVNLGQISFIFRSPSGLPCAYATWAYLSKPVHDQFLQRGPRLLSLAEWNEGTHLWIVDVQARSGSVPFLKTVVLQDAVKHHTKVYGARYDINGSRSLKCVRLPEQNL